MPITRTRERLEPSLVRMGLVLTLGAILAMLDTTIVNVGMDTMGRDLHGSLDQLQWVSTGYLLAVSMVMPLSGWVSERFGAKTMWLTSVALFVAGSALCGLAWSPESLIVFRVIQGVGGGMMQPIGQSIVAQAAGPSRIGRVMGVLTIPITFAPVLGPVLGGLIAGVDWRWMFYVNVPIGLVTLLLAARFVPAAPPAGPRAPLDVRGLALLSPGLAAVVYGFARLASGAGATLPLAVGGLLVAGYAVHALRAAAPLIDLRLFARRGFAAATGSSFLLGASVYSSMLLIPLYYQRIEGASALEAGLLLAPQALGTAVVTFFASRLSDRIGPRPLILAGIGLAMAGTVAFALVAARPAAWVLTFSLVVRGAGLGMMMAPGMAAVYSSVERHETPRAASALNVLNRVGGSIGTAVLAMVLQSGHATPAAFGTAFWWALGLSALTLVPAALYPAKKS
ncbi:MDR family MFS transporter [Nonomuraea sediminis]|uniref:MDR family MFS transporter n=1 Tax=Nonomuraea sediminis TaxID=2835864 RepID=UPI001BDCB2DC|nr:MDR family MFS transporter [Nonomuraea sediminis]